MAKKGLNCIQVSALLNFYAEGTLNLLLKKLVKDHLEKCPDCMEKYLNILEKSKNNRENIAFDTKTENYDTKQYKEFKTNLSAYIDNELSSDENIKIKKLAISNPLARKELENIYKFKNIMYESFVKTKENVKSDFSKKVINVVQKELKHENVIGNIDQVLHIFLIIVAFILAGFVFYYIFKYPLFEYFMADNF